MLRAILVILALSVPAVLGQCIVPEAGRIGGHILYCSGTYFPGGTIVLDQDASVICNRTVLVGPNEESGFLVIGDNVSVKGCTLAGYQYAVVVEEAKGTWLGNNVLENNTAGVLAVGAEDFTITNNKLQGGFGIALQGSYNGIISNNRINAAKTGIILNQSNANTLFLNSVRSAEYNLILGGSAANAIFANTFYNAQVAFDSRNSYGRGKIANTYLQGATGPAYHIAENISEATDSASEGEVLQHLNLERKAYARMAERAEKLLRIRKEITAGRNETLVLLHVMPVSPVSGLIVAESIPKCMAKSSYQISFAREPAVIKEDPLVMWLFDEPVQGELNLSYSTPGMYNESGCEALPVTIALVREEHRPGNYLPLLLLPVIFIAYVWVRRFSSSGTHRRIPGTRRHKR